jgi:phosphoribosyl-dephospho-CoA transferase
MSALPRHALVWPTAAAWRRLRSEGCDEAACAAFVRWEAAAWPLVVRRTDGACAAPADATPCGLALPPAPDRRKLAVVLRQGEVARHAPPLALACVADALPDRWRACARELVRGASAAEIRLRVFGSAAWQALTGLAYLHEASDLDLLVAPRGRDDIGRAIALFERAGRAYGRRIDGEIVFPEGGAVAWREWPAATRSARVLVKHRDRATLERCDDLLAQFDRRAVPA